MDLYNIFDSINDDEENVSPESEMHAFDSDFDNEETFVSEEPIIGIIAETPFPVTEADPLGIAGNAKPLNTAGTENTTHTNSSGINDQTQHQDKMKFDLPEHTSIIKVIGVGGGGSNAVNHMYRQGINGVDFVVCNTDKQALDMSPVPHKVVLGATLTEGRGAGSIPEVGRNSAIENIEDIRSILANNTKMVFITAGMGGGTGTGAAPIIAGIAREMGILTVAIVTVPFLFEGKKRRQQAEEGLEQLKQNVDTLLVICNDKLREMYGNLKLSEAFGHADDVLAIAAKSIAEVISLTQQINVDFADICTVMRNSGVAIMGSSVMSGENRSIRAVEEALNSPLLNDNNITGARYVLLNIISGSDEITMDELGEITDYIQDAAGQTAEIIKGYGVEPSLGDSVSVTIIATGFNQNNPIAYEYSKKPEQQIIVRNLEEAKAEPVAELKAEKKVETVNPLEPFLINKQPELVLEETKEEIVQPVAEITNPLEPFLKTSEAEPEIINEIQQEEIVSVSNPLEPFMVVKTEEISEVNSEIVSEPVLDAVSPLIQVTSEIENISSEEISAPVAGENLFSPVQNTEVEFEITNFSSEHSDENPSAEIQNEEIVDSNWSEPVAEFKFFSEPVSENNAVEEPSMEISEEPVAEINSVNEIFSEVNSVNEPVAEMKEEIVSKSEPVIEKQSDEEIKRIQAEEIQKKAQERIQRLKELSMKLKTPQGLNEMEHEPAYKRRNIQLENVPHSSESQVSRFTLTETDEKKIEIRPNNSFLHDNVD